MWNTFKKLVHTHHRVDLTKKLVIVHCQHCEKVNKQDDLKNLLISAGGDLPNILPCLSPAAWALLLPSAANRAAPKTLPAQGLHYSGN